MSTRLNPYLQRKDGDARAAIEFYASVFGGQPTIMTFADAGGMGMPEEEQHLLMHSDLVVNDSVAIMVADVPSSMTHDQGNLHISLSGDEADTLRSWFDGLAEGGTVDVPLEKAPWGDHYGQVKDKFGINWMFNIAEPAAG
ncbi:VOC family protein [Nocardioides litoris]|uniref:VOC family protein n=1 Tax=Nocardioides litoris TaxID=1926648 RepID=UPI00111F2E32|nr:VOC family protein [Nocardioides litoris]